jgi:two-component system, sensor histidine kinase YesM
VNLKLWSAFNNLTLRRKLLVTYLTVAIVPIMVIGTVSYLKFSATLTQQTREYANLVVTQINRDLDAYIEKLERLTYTAYLNIDLQKILETNHRVSFKEQLDNRELVHQYLSRINIIDSRIDGSYIYSENGSFFFENSQGTMKSTYDLPREEWYRLIVSGSKKTLVIPPHLEQKYDNFFQSKNFSYVRALHNVNNGRYLGLIMVDVNLKAIDAIVGEAGSKIKGRLQIRDDLNNLVYDSFGEAPNKAKDGSYRQSREGDSGKNNLVIASHSRYTGWKVIFITPLAAIMEKVYQIRTYTLIVTIGCLVIFILVSARISSSISRPINKLKQAIGMVENGDLDAKVEIENQDEVGELSRSFNKMVQNIKRLVNEVFEAQLKKKEAEFSALQSQINPHFMYNTLESINMLAILKGNFEISDILTAFSNILRFNIDNKNNLVTIGEELKYVADYLMIQKFRYQEKIEVVYDIDPDMEKYQILKLMLQPLVENAIYHGITEKQGPGLITIAVKKDGRRLKLTVTDNGLGIHPERLEDIVKSLEQEESVGKNDSIGLKNINERIKLYFGPEYGIRFESQPGTGTKVELIIPAVCNPENRSG